MTTALLKYDVACRALAEAATIDEVKDILDKAEALRVYRRQAKDTKGEEDFTRIRLRAKRKLGEKLIEEKQAGHIHEGRPRKKNGSENAPLERTVLDDLDIDKRLSAESQQLAILDSVQFENLERTAIERIRSRGISIKGARSTMSSRVEAPDSLDYFPTPPWATRALMELVLGGPFHSIWEPACGEGHMAEVLREYCDHVHATDIFDYGYGIPDVNFLDGEPEAFEWDWIITNPPFEDRTEPFVLQAIRAAHIGVAMFVRLQWLESVGRYERVFRDHPPTCIAFFAERVPLCKGKWEPKNATATAYIWLVWIKDQEPRAPFWIPPGQRKRLTKPDDAARFTAHPVIRKEDYDSSTGEIQNGAAPHGGTTAPEPASAPSDLSPQKPLAGAGSPVFVKGEWVNDDESKIAPLS